MSETTACASDSPSSFTSYSNERSHCLGRPTIQANLVALRHDAEPVRTSREQSTFMPPSHPPSSESVHLRLRTLTIKVICFHNFLSELCMRPPRIFAPVSLCCNFPKASTGDAIAITRWRHTSARFELPSSLVGLTSSSHFCASLYFFLTASPIELVLHH